ncbi:MAG: hypothetical protein H5T69_15270 [Chloroflexi bacterium]|nr:hypothetical protein [Chloroflexota bacterium]
MKKILRALLLAVLLLALVVPFSVSAQAKPLMTVSGKIWNGTNGGPETPVTVRLYRDTGAGDVLIREETFPGSPGHQFSEMGDFLFQVNCVRGYYTLEIDAFMEGGADAVGVAWWAGHGAWGENVLLKKEAGQPGPWTFSWYEDCGLPAGWEIWGDLIFEYSTVAGPRANAAWMYIGGKVFDPTIWTSMTYNKCGDQLRSWQDVDPFQAVEGVTIYVDKIAYNESTNIAVPVILEAYGPVVTGDKGFWGLGIKREPGFYRITLDENTLPGPNPVLVSANPLYFQVFDVFGTGGPGNGYGPGSSWLPWNFMQPEWVYSYFNFAATGTWTVHPVNVPPCP